MPGLIRAMFGLLLTFVVLSADAESMGINQALSCLVKPCNQAPLRVDVIDFRQQGFAARSKTVVRQGRTLRRLKLTGFESIDATLNTASRIEQTPGIRDARVWKQPDS